MTNSSVGRGRGELGEVFCSVAYRSVVFPHLGSWRICTLKKANDGSNGSREGILMVKKKEKTKSGDWRVTEKRQGTT